MSCNVTPPHLGGQGRDGWSSTSSALSSLSLLAGPPLGPPLDAEVPVAVETPRSRGKEPPSLGILTALWPPDLAVETRFGRFPSETTISPDFPWVSGTPPGSGAGAMGPSRWSLVFWSSRFLGLRHSLCSVPLSTGSVLDVEKISQQSVLDKPRQLSATSLEFMS